MSEFNANDYSSTMFLELIIELKEEEIDFDVSYDYFNATKSKIYVNNYNSEGGNSVIISLSGRLYHIVQMRHMPLGSDLPPEEIKSIYCSETRDAIDFIKKFK